MEQIGGEGLDVGFGHPGRSQVAVDVAGQHVLRLHASQGLGVAGEGGAGGLRRGELGPHVAGEIGVGRLPGLGLRVAEDQVAQLGDHPLLRLAVERSDEGQIDRALLVEGDEQPLLGAGDRRDGRLAAHHVLLHDGGLASLAGDLVVLLQAHDEHGVGVLAELDQVGHAADDVAVGGGAEGGLVDGSVGADEALIGPVEFAAGVVAVRLGPALVLRLQDAAGAVAQSHQGGQALAGERAVGGERRAAVGDRDGPAVDRLADGAVVADEETALRNVLERRGRGESRCCGWFLGEGGGGRRRLRQAADGLLELRGQVAAPRDAVTFAVERVPGGPGPEHHLRVVQEIAVDGETGAFDLQGGDVFPAGIGVMGFLVRGALAQEDDVGDDRRALVLEGGGGQADRPEEVGAAGEVLADRGVLFVQREMRGHHRQHAAGLEGVGSLGDEVVVQAEALAVVFQLHVGEGDVADHRVERGQLRISEVLDADVLAGVERPGDAAGDRIQFDADEAHGGRGVAHEIADAAAGFQHEGVVGNAEAGDGAMDRLHHRG